MCMQKYDVLIQRNSIDTLDIEQYDFYKKQIAASEELYPITKKINHIPHLQLQSNRFNYNLAQTEIEQNISSYTPANGRDYYDTKKYGPLNHPEWTSRALINYAFDSDKFFGNKDKEFATITYPELQPEALVYLNKNKQIPLNVMRTYKTDLYDKMPYITNYVFENICDKVYRLFIWKLEKHGKIHWHNHANLVWNKELEVNEFCIVHIPVVSNPKVEMLVKKDKDIISKYYEPGNAYIFNNVLDHAVINDSDYDRIHVVAFVPWSDTKLSKLIDASV